MKTCARTLAAAAAVLALGLSACGGGDDGDEDDSSSDTTEESTTTTAAAETTTTTLSPEGEVLAAYDRAQAALETAYDPADPNHPELLATFDGAQLTRHQTYLTEYQFEGVSNALLSKESNPALLTMDETTATVQDCMTEVLQLVDTATREPQADERTNNWLLESDLERVDGLWKVVQVRTAEESC